MRTGPSLFSSPEPKGLIALGISAFHSVLLFSNTAPFLPHLHIPGAPRDPFSVLLISHLPPSLLLPHDSRSTMGLGTVIPTVSNTIGAVIVGWGVSSLYVPVSRDRVLYPHLAYAAASSACFASKCGHTTCDIQMIVLHTRFWYVNMDTVLPSGVG